MNFDVTNTDWLEVENLNNNSTYVLQAKNFFGNLFMKSYTITNILFAQAENIPEDNKTGILASDIKFKKIEGLNIYIKAIGTPTNIDIQEVQ